METIALISQKGGVGKTTLAIHLATAFETAGRQTLLVDLDPQTSAAEWKDARQAERPYVMAVPPSRLGKTLEAAKEHEAELVVLDTAPHSEGTALDAARAADLILVPCQPSIMDLRAMRKTADLLNYLKKPTFAVLNEVAAQGTVADEAARAITAQFEMARAAWASGSPSTAACSPARRRRSTSRAGKPRKRLLPLCCGLVSKCGCRLVH